MATVGRVAKSALQRILVQGSEAPFEADEYQDFIDDLNNFMAALEAEGVKLGYTPVSSLNDDVTVPAGALRGIIDNLAIEVAPDYGGVVSPELIQNAANGMKAMRHLGQRIGKTCYPSTLPIGSGNEGWTDRRFYPGHPFGCCCADCIQAEDESCILTESD